MTQYLYAFPAKAKFGRMVAKSKIYAHITISAKLKELFVREVEKITWAYKLSPETINLPATKEVREIQVFSLTLKGEDLSLEILKAIDRAIPFPILFELNGSKGTRYVACYKRPDTRKNGRKLLSNYFQSDWLKPQDDKSTVQELPVALNMSGLYEQLLKNLSPLPVKEGENLKSLVERTEQTQRLECEINQLEDRVKKEKQFNRRVELNQTLNSLKKEFAKLGDDLLVKKKDLQ